MSKYFFIKLFFILIGMMPLSVFATTLTGGDFILNGNFTSINSSGSGGNFILNSSVENKTIQNTDTSQSSSGGSSSYGKLPTVKQNTNTALIPNIKNIITEPKKTIEKVFNTGVGDACTPYIKIKKPISVDNENDPELVKKIEIFLDKYENASLVVNGFYGSDDELAVKKFQEKYYSDILAPWKYTQATGIVYVTTSAKINSIVCGINTSSNISVYPQTNAYTKVQILEKKTQNYIHRVVDRVIHSNFIKHIKYFFKKK